MRKLLSSAVIMTTTIGLMGGMVVPQAASAAVKKAPVAVKKAPVKKAPVKKTYTISVSKAPVTGDKELDDSKTRCLTKEIKAMHVKTVSRMEADLTKKGVGFEKAVGTYKEKIDIVWSAMEQPYCGFGSQGLSAVKHSYNKSVERIRAEFLAAKK